MMESGIYKITSKKHPKRIYVGSAKYLKRRQQEHVRRLKDFTHPNIKLRRHAKKYGLDDLVFDTIEYCNVEELIQKEQHWMDALNPWFNICRVAGNTIGVAQSEKTKRKRSESLIKYYSLKEWTKEDKEAYLEKVSKHRQKQILEGQITKIEDSIFINIKMLERALTYSMDTEPKEARIRYYANPRRGSSSPYVGVTYEKVNKSWRGQIKINGKSVKTKYFPTAEQANEARIEKLKELGFVQKASYVQAYQKRVF